jgi:uncharacterized protein YndB with AHSA1/START domain
VRYATSVDVDAPAARVWAVLVDVERWPEWTASMRRVERLDAGEFVVGSRARVKQPRFPAVVWEVTDAQSGRSFRWTASAAGVRTVADHRIAERQGGVTVTLEITQTGLLVPLLDLLGGKLARRYVDTEARGLKERCERTGPTT